MPGPLASQAGSVVFASASIILRLVTMYYMIISNNETHTSVWTRSPGAMILRLCNATQERGLCLVCGHRSYTTLILAFGDQGEPKRPWMCMRVNIYEGHCTHSQSPIFHHILSTSKGFWVTGWLSSCSRYKTDENCKYICTKYKMHLCLRPKFWSVLLSMTMHFKDIPDIRLMKSANALKDLRMTLNT